MTTLKASTEQIRIFVEQKRAEEQAMLAAAAERVRGSRERLHRQANPLRYRQAEAVKEASGMETAPTAQRVAKGGVALHPIYNAQGIAERRVYRSKGPVESYAETWPNDVYNAFVDFIVDARAADGPPITIDYNRNGGSSLGKLGGLGNVHDKVRDAYSRFMWVRERLTGGSCHILDWLVLEVKREATGQAMTLSDVGTKIFPAFRDKATSKGIAIGRLLGAGDELAKLYRLHSVISKGRLP